MKNLRIGILFSDFGPYHVARIDALGYGLKSRGFDLIAYRFAATSKTYSWNSEKPDSVKTISLTEGKYESILDSLVLAKRFANSLKSQKIDVVFLPSYSPIPNLFCAIAAKFIGCKLIMMNESWEVTERANFLGKYFKRQFIKLFDAAVVGGTPHKKYFSNYGLSPSKIFLGYDVVHTNYYKSEASKWSSIDNNFLPIHLPNRFFLNLGRFVIKKNLELLISAYSEFVIKNPNTEIALVLVGDGDQEDDLKSLVQRLNLMLICVVDIESKTVFNNKPQVVFYPFQQIQTTPIFFTKCEAFILPSLYEEWGLVINEAMACGSAVVVSNRVGCSFDLVNEDVNGYTFDPNSITDLTQILQRFEDNASLANTLGIKSQELIKEWGLSKFSTSAINAIEACYN